MIVARRNFSQVVEKLSKKLFLGLDTETTGLSESDRLFSVIFADEDDAYYFNFNSEPDHQGNRAPEENILPWSCIDDLNVITSNPESTFFLHNAKFDMRMLSKENVEIAGHIHDTEVIERVLKNNHYGSKPYSLKSTAKRYGYEKDEAVEEYIKAHKLYEKIKVPGKEKLFEKRFYNKVPFNIIAPYGQTDAIITLAIGLAQQQIIARVDRESPATVPRLWILANNERKLTKTCFRMERRGITVDRDYTENALEYTNREIEKKKDEFNTLTGIEFSGKTSEIVEAFRRAGIELPKTATGKPCTDKRILDELENPIADKIREIRKAEKLASTYYSSFLHFADERGLIHANMRQAGTETGRFSYSDPNLQNIPKEDEPEDKKKPYIVRKCFVPSSPEFCLVAIDYNQQEYRVMADYAGEHALIARIMDGEDVHAVTAEMLGVTRKAAKTLNFGLLYGMGAAKLARALGVDMDEAIRLRHLYFSRLPSVSKFTRQVMRNGEIRGFVFNWFGFRSYIVAKEYAYVLPNHIVQGSCAQVLRIAMNRIDEYMRLNKMRSGILVQVHDELLFEFHESELHHIAPIREIMESVYPGRNGMKLTCSVEHSWTSWGKVDMQAGLPDAKTRDQIQNAHSATA